MNTTENNELTIPIVTTVKALFLYILFFNYGFINPFSYELPFLPFISFLDWIPSVAYQILSVVLGLSVIVPFLAKNNYRLFAFISGITVLFFILSSKILQEMQALRLRRTLRGLGCTQEFLCQNTPHQQRNIKLVFMGLK